MSMRSICTCGHPFWVQRRWNGLEYVPVYRDGREESATVGQEVTHCPTCGEWLAGENGHQEEA